MIEISFNEIGNYKDVLDKYIFFFTIPSLCSLCGMQEKEYLKYDIRNLVKVKGAITDEETMMKMDIQALPCTIIFNKDGSEKIKKYGIQYESQIRDLLEKIKA